MTDIRQQLLEARQDVERARQRLQQERSRLSSRATISQTSGRAGVLQRQMATGTIAQQEQVVQQREQELKQVEQQLPGREEYSDADALKIARKLYKAKVGVKNTRGKIRQYYKELRDNEDAAVESTVDDIERQLNMSIEPKLKAKIEEDVRKAVTGDIRLAELNDRLNIKLGNQTLDPSQLQSLDVRISQIASQTLPTPPPRAVTPGVPPLRERLTIAKKGQYGSIIQDIDTLFQYAGGKTTSFLAREGLVRSDSPLGKVLSSPAEVSVLGYKVRSPSPGEITIGTFFAPGFKTGTSSFQEVAEQQLNPLKKKKKKVTEKDLEILENKFIVDYTGTREQIRSLIKANLGNKKGLNQIKKILEGSIGERGKVLYKDLVAQERAALPELIVRPKVDVSVLGNIPEQRGAGVVTGAFAGQGTYERTNEVAAPILQGKSTNILQIDTITPLKTDTSQMNILKTDTNQRQRLNLLSLNISKSKQDLGQKQPQQQASPPILGTPVETATSTVQQQRQRQTEGQQPRYPRPPMINQPRLRAKLLLGLPRATSYSVTQGQKNIMLRKAYNVLIGRGKKARIIAKGLPLNVALREGVKRNLGDITASFKLIESGRTARQDISFKVPEQFIPSKSEKGRLVQRRGTRLSSRGEVSQILKARKEKRLRWF